jgi:uncharacterized membrane protein
VEAPPTNARIDGARRDNAGFRLRGLNVTRIESFSDGVFAFALTLLVVSLDVPKSFAELKETLNGFIGFGLSFVLLMALWYRHRELFRRYGLDDDATLAWNAALLFLVLFFIYPLKFLVSMMMHDVFGIGRDIKHGVSNADGTTLMLVYSGGYLAVYAVFFMMYFHAWRKRAELELDPLEELLTRESLAICAILMSIALLSIAVAWIGGPSCTAIAGLTYFLIGPARAFAGGWFGKRARAMERR